MSQPKVYLDTSALVKRYVEEEGSEKIDSLFDKAYRDELILVTSQWNIAEASVVFDKYERRALLNAVDTFNLLQNEMETMVRMGLFRIIPLFGNIVAESIRLIFTYHIYVADAVQILTCQQERCDQFVTFDKKLREIAKSEKLNILDP